MGSDDAELMRRWRGGDNRAFEDLVDRWQQPVARFLYRLTGRANLVADLVQEVFLRVFQAGARYRENGSFAPWLYRIALNVGRDAQRRQRNTLPLDPTPASAAATAEDTFSQQETAALVAAAVAELPEPLRIVLTLRHDEELSFEDIARLTATPASTLKSRFAAALTRLRQRLTELGLAPEENIK
jgi:RNA polymerase sigma-70 factor (ECF subfamily)